MTDELKAAVERLRSFLESHFYETASLHRMTDLRAIRDALASAEARPSWLRQGGEDVAKTVSDYGHGARAFQSGYRAGVEAAAKTVGGLLKADWSPPVIGVLNIARMHVRALVSAPEEGHP